MTDQYITPRAVRERLGGVSEMTLWRWLRAEALKFPQPVRINGRRYFLEAEVAAWLDAQKRQAA